MRPNGAGLPGGTNGGGGNPMNGGGPINGGGKNGGGGILPNIGEPGDSICIGEGACGMSSAKPAVPAGGSVIVERKLAFILKFSKLIYYWHR